jgi:hypothetical protein
MLRLLCKVFGVQTATVALLTGEAIYITGACGALEACVCPDRWGFCGWSFTNSTHELLVRAARCVVCLCVMCRGAYAWLCAAACGGWGALRRAGAPAAQPAAATHAPHTRSLLALRSAPPLQTPPPTHTRTHAHTTHAHAQVVEDMDADARFSANFFVVDPAFHLKFYVAAPLISANGHRLGTL